MPATLGQGGNHAIEGAVVLAVHAADYTAARLPRTTAIARQGRPPEHGRGPRHRRRTRHRDRRAVEGRPRAVAARLRRDRRRGVPPLERSREWGRPPYAAGRKPAGNHDRERT
ncbi:hypothetical protein [Streptomyces sp. NPDC051636]|uniref:hypothetical protein n=1 Tax=Streptomyces sp. NPDC051636 TaxID=3365663 RepID=UPI0037BC7354